MAGISWTATGIYYLPILWAVIPISLFFIYYSRIKGESKPILLFYPLIFFSIGTIHTVAYTSGCGNKEIIQHLFPEKREAVISGRLLTAPEIGRKRTKLLLAADRVFPPDTERPGFIAGRLQNGNGLIKAESRAINGKILLRMEGYPPADISPGDRLLVRALLSPPDRYKTPGSFDYPAYLAEKAIYLQGWIKSTGHIMKLQEEAAALPVWREFLITAEKFRQLINNFLTANLSPGTAGLYKAILTGDREMVPPQVLENFKKTGVMHLLAISGVHMGLLALCCGLGLNFLIRRSERLLLKYNAGKLICFLTIPILMGYALIAGLKPPVLRALIMTIIFYTAIINDRQHHLPTHISIAALIMLTINPLLLFSASFQLSFAAVIGIIIVLPKAGQILGLSRPAAGRPSVLDRLKQWFIAGLLVSVAASLVTLPLLLYYFNRFSPISPLTTLLVEPLICFWSLIIGLLSCPLIFIAPEWAKFLFEMGGTGLSGADLITHKLAELPFADIWLSTPSLPEIISYYLLLSAFFLERRGGTARRLLIAFFVAVLVLCPLFCKYRERNRPYDRISFLDVGQGSSTVLELRRGEIIVIDGGGPYSERFNVGRSVIAPYLWGKRISKIDQLVISHPDSDHCNGLPFIVRHFRPDTVWLNNSTPDDSKIMNRLTEAAEKAGSALTVPEQGEILSSSPESMLQNLAGLHLASDYSEENNRSLVLKLTSNDFSFLFPGDIEHEAEKKLLQKGMEIKADVLLAPHHGSISSGSENFAEAVDPDYTVISAGKYRNDVFPAPEVLNIYQNLGSKVFNTSEQGTITFRSRDSALEIETFVKPR